MALQVGGWFGDLDVETAKIKLKPVIVFAVFVVLSS